MCNFVQSVGVTQDNNNKAELIASVLTHELGHNLGMFHDTDSCTCSTGQCIMKPAIDFYPPLQFSSCSLWDYEQYAVSEDAQCILNDPFPTDIVPTAVCGNRFVEEGEECDCGPPEFKKAGELCQAAKDDCDLPEFCTGQSAVCPLNRFHKDGHPCQNNTGYCFKGTCPTLANQCIALWGADAKVAPDGCFLNNQKGDEIGHCRKENSTYIPCEPKDVKCGRLYCTDDSTEENSCKFRFSKENADVGMVEPATKCGEGMVCALGQCFDTETAFST